MIKMAHTCIRVLDDERSVDWYSRAFALEISDRLDFEDFRITFLVNRQTGYELELTLNKGRTEPYELGDGYGHIALIVDDVESTHRRLEKEGMSVGKIVNFKPSEELIARFFFATDPDGYKVEVIQKGGRFV